LNWGDELLSQLLSSEIKGQLLILFHKNPGLIDTIDGVACRIGRTAEAIGAEVEDLVALGMLRMKRVGQSEVIHLDVAKDNEVQTLIIDHLGTLRKERRF
jgi:hypothetical protein